MGEITVFPQARKAQLVIETLGDEVLTYDLDADVASCLNDTARRVWLCCDGKNSVEEIAATMARDLKVADATALVWYALAELSARNLLQEKITPPTKFVFLSRRDFLRRVGWVGAAGLIPNILSIGAPSVNQGGTCLGVDGFCGTNSALCCPPLCCKRTGAGANTCQAVGSGACF